MDPPVSVARMPPGQPLDLLAQGIARPDSQRRPAAGRGSPLFFCDVLEHLLVQEQLGDEPLEVIDLELQLSAPAIRVDLLSSTFGDYSNVTGADSRIARQGTGRIDLGPAQYLRIGPQLGERLDPKPDCVGRVPTGR